MYVCMYVCVCVFMTLLYRSMIIALFYTGRWREKALERKVYNIVNNQCSDLRPILSFIITN